ncbi:SCO family protein [Thalassotalea sp. 1_MG-2023]|uniref:SCO family protein n=1 Tax=Thalassotalea sp. 1_MG-2023 TaxID=3062680 RepID=UPI0026E379B0|nr:SCO family protein [Thalassotalea sp. 1_MG-2023]MDO6427331.1 SCO family protein [Thalassotalea sp. 1_MG-2023]
MHNWALIILLLVGISISIVISMFSPIVGTKSSVKYSAINWLDSPRLIKEFELTTLDNTYNNQSMYGHWTIIVFGFIQCADICPTSLWQLSLLQQELIKLGIEQQVKVVFVSVDHERDTIESINRYVRYFNPAFIGATGKKPHLTAITSSLGVRFKVLKSSSRYTVAHSLIFSVIGPKGKLIGRFMPGFSTTDTANALHKKMKVSLSK